VERGETRANKKIGCKTGTDNTPRRPQLRTSFPQRRGFMSGLRPRNCRVAASRMKHNVPGGSPPARAGMTFLTLTLRF